MHPEQARRSPTVSIGLPVYNGERYLPEALESILGQDYPDFELWISDNASSDGTEDICRSFARADSRIRYFRQQSNLGAAANYNFVFKRSSGKYFKWAAHDDRIRPAFLRRCVETYESFESRDVYPSIVYPKSVFIDETGSMTRADPMDMHTTARHAVTRGLHAINRLSMATPVFGLMPRALLEKTRLIGSFIGSDYVLIYEAALLGPIIQMSDELFERRIHGGMSRLANTSKRDALKWFDPNAKQALSTRRKLFVEYQRSTWRLPKVSPVEKLACSLGLCVVLPARRARVKLGAYRRKLIGVQY